MSDDPGTAASTVPSTEDQQQIESSDERRRVLHARVTEQTKKKADFVDEIMLHLDMLIYTELCIVYYMDCSFLRFFFRVLAQVLFLTPKPAFVPAPSTPRPPPYVGAILGPNIFCLAFHLYSRAPAAGEAARGYLHGSVIIDFIGYKGPSSKLQLVCLDLLILALQCFMLAVYVEKERLKAALAVGVPRVSSSATVLPNQDHDSEERGEYREIVVSDGGDNMEMQSLGRIEGEDNDNRGDYAEERALLSSDNELLDPHDGPLDLFYSGNAILAEFHVMHTLRNQWRNRNAASASALQTVGHSAGYSWTRMQNRLSRLENIGS